MTTSSFTIPFYKKEKDYTCGIAALRMALGALTKINYSENQLEETLKCSPDFGTSLKLFNENLRLILTWVFDVSNIHLDFVIKENSDTRELIELLKQDYVVLINYTKPRGGPHWAVLKSIDENEIILSDPDFGPNTQYNIADFNWVGGIKNRVQSAFVAIKLIS